MKFHFRSYTSSGVEVRTVKSELDVTRLDLETLEKDMAATVEFSAPQLPGGVRAEGSTCAGGYVYAVNPTTEGSGYTEVPSVVINGDGTGHLQHVEEERNKGSRNGNCNI